MTNARADSGSSEVETVLGVKDDIALDALAAMPTDQEELIDVSLDNCDIMVAGFEMQAGGKEVTLNEGQANERKFIEEDQLVVHLKVEDIDGIDFTRQFFTLPKETKGDDGVARRRPVSQFSKWGFYLATLSGLGISSDPAQATEFLLANGVQDLAGLRYHRQRMDFDGPRNSIIQVEVPTELHGFDNEFRKSLGMEPAELTSTAQAEADA